MLYTCWDISISSLRTAILDFWLPLAPHNIVYSFIEFLDQENMGRAVGIIQLSCNQTELLFFLKFFQKITAICSRHLKFLSDNIDAIIVSLCSPTIFKKSHQSISVISMRFTNSGQKIGLVGNLIPLGRWKVKCGIRYNLCHNHNSFSKIDRVCYVHIAGSS